MGAPDPHLDKGFNIDFRIQCMLRAYAKQDPPPNRVKPVPVSVLCRIMTVAHASTDHRTQAIADMICIAFFYLLRPGEYVVSASDSVPFTLDDVQLFRGDQRLDLRLASPAELLTATTFSTLTPSPPRNSTFTHQSHCLPHPSPS